jgi:metal-responsive CopG/Arc/MetJ family transcriptional regulator
VCYDVGMAPPTTPVHVRLESTALKALEEIGQNLKPKPLNRSEMINVAIAAYVEQNKGGVKYRSAAKPK